MKKILFLGYNTKETKIIEAVKIFKSNKISQTKTKVSLKYIQNFDLVISFGYKHLLNAEITNNYKKIINLHIGYLPFNKGAHPNFWSFAENTPSGVTIHKIDKGINTGKIIYQKQLDFELLKNRKKLTFNATNKRLVDEIENLFIKNVKKLLQLDFDEFDQVGKGSYHDGKNLPNILKSWNQNIFKTVLDYNKQTKKFIQDKLNLITEVENTRKHNNVNWMNILRTSIKNSPSDTLKILDKINQDDDRISKVFKKLNEK
tara:strand:- start:1322 stop:2098 length:777 start_codon:yes stop_codon:yes gene_type:complete